MRANVLVLVADVPPGLGVSVGYDSTVGAMLVVRVGKVAFLRAGIGWDDDLPLSPWPATHNCTSKSGWRDWSAAWCGLFIGMTRP